MGVSSIEKSRKEKSLISDVPYVKQKKYTCGPASAEMVLKYYGIDKISQELINRADPENKKGTNYKKLAKHLKKLGFPVQLYSGDIEKLKSFIENEIPVIVRQWFDLSKKSRHYRLVIGIDNEKEEIITHDPKKGRNYRLQKEEFLELWKIGDKKTKYKSRNLMIVIEKGLE